MPPELIRCKDEFADPKKTLDDFDAGERPDDARSRAVNTAFVTQHSGVAGDVLQCKVGLRNKLQLGVAHRRVYQHPQRAPLAHEKDMAKPLF